MPDVNPWNQILERLKTELDDEDFRRWFGATAYASDSGDQITVWVGSEAIRRHIGVHYQESLQRALTAIGRPGTQCRLVVAGFGSEDEDDEEQ